MMLFSSIITKQCVKLTVFIINNEILSVSLNDKR